MNYEYLDCDIRDGAARVSLLGAGDAPAGEVCDELVDLLLRLQEDRVVRVILFSDAGGPFDMAFDMHGVAESWPSGEGPGRMAGDMDTARRIIFLLQDLAKPVISAVTGEVRDAGFGLIMNTDVRLAAPSATFAMGGTSLGMVPDWGLSHLLPRRMGAGRTLEMMWSGRSVGAEEAHAMGLVDRLVDPDAWDETVEGLLERIAAIPQPAAHMCKMTVQQSMQFDLTTALSLEFEAQEKCWESQETSAALAAYLVGDKPDFSVIPDDEDA